MRSAPPPWKWKSTARAPPSRAAIIACRLRSAAYRQIARHQSLLRQFHRGSLASCETRAACGCRRRDRIDRREHELRAGDVRPEIRREGVGLALAAERILESHIGER